jgi:hypothetical protein
MQSFVVLLSPQFFVQIYAWIVTEDDDIAATLKDKGEKKKEEH